MHQVLQLSYDSLSCPVRHLLNTVKNVFILLIAFLYYPVLKRSLESVGVSNVNDLLLIISILLVTVCFANFAFSYQYTKKNPGIILLSHLVTFVFMLLTLLLLEVMVISVSTVYPGLQGIVTVFSVLLYLGIILYDAWDYVRLHM
ncbi:MAG: hypothetical protein ABIC95_01510 [archaeon]